MHIISELDILSSLRNKYIFLLAQLMFNTDNKNTVCCLIVKNCKSLAYLTEISIDY